MIVRVVRFFYFAFFCLLLLSVSALSARAQINFPFHSEYRYLKGKDAAGLPTGWKEPGFDDSAWQEGSAPFRYGDGAYGVELTDMINTYTTLYLRSTFLCSSPDRLIDLVFTADYDDGFIVWVNGIEALRANAPASPAYNSVAPANHESGTAETFVVYKSSLELLEGNNVIAIQAFNLNSSSSDFYFDMSVFAEEHLPEITDTIGIGFSVASGFYDNPFDVVLTSPDPSRQIVYTLDGSNPQTSENVFYGNSPLVVRIDPASLQGRSETPGVVVRASQAEEGYKSSKPSSVTYLFMDYILNQTWPGGDWPVSMVNEQLIDLEMDREVIENPLYSSSIDDALLDLPSISITTDLKNLFDPQTGIYVNAEGHGTSWERDCGVELINPDGSPGFSVNAGLRIRGGASRSAGFPKHSFRLFFREKYGMDKLRFPLFGDEGASVFDKIDLRTEQNYAWSTGNSLNSMVREVFSRDSQRDMGRPYTRSRYYHLYINGMYWGLYQTQERSEARFASTYFGGKDEDYDVIKVNTENYAYSVEATDGNTDSWKRLWDMCATGFASNADYYRLEGKDENGNPVKGGEVMVDIDNLIDYMMVIFYTGNFDAPSSSFFSNKGANNFYAIDDRTDRSKGFTFYAHDSEHSLFDEPRSPGVGITEDRVNLGTRTDNYVMEVAYFSRFHPQWLHFKLTENAEYRARFADRAYMLLNKGGAFDPANSLERLNKRVEQIDLAVIAESARWGDGKRPQGSPYTRNNQWMSEIKKIRENFIPVRNAYVIRQLQTAGLYPEVIAPQVKTSGEIIDEDRVLLSSPVEIEIINPNPTGVLYYTTNGVDPRDDGGKIYSGSLFCLDDITMDITGSTVLFVRVYANGKWSAPERISFVSQVEDYSNLRITEIHYHPSEIISGNDTTGGKDLEFIEFKNTGKTAIDLSGLVLDSAVYHEFSEGFLLAPSQFYVIASKPSYFYDEYGLVASGNYRGNLSNAGEQILLTDPQGTSLMNFFYSDDSPWPGDADGDGYSLSSVDANPAGNPGNEEYWTISVKKGGTPFADNVDGGPVTPGKPDGSLLVYPNPSTGPVTLRLISDKEINQVRITLYNLSGKPVYETIVGNPGMFDLNEKGLAAGVYIMNVAAEGYNSRIRIILIK